jgi:hypothetical protein
MARRTLVLDQPVESSNESKKKSRKGIYVGIAILALVPVIGSTYAASISVNNNSAIEFGQGQNAVTACDSEITITPTSSFTPGANNTDGTFSLATVVLGGVDTSACNLKSFQLIARDASGNALSGGTITFKLDSSVTTAGSAGIAASPAISGATGNVASSDVTLNVTGSISASDLARFTIETS